MKHIYRTIPYTISCLSLLAAMNALAVPANPRPQPVTQPDGSVIMTRLIGDEHGHFILNEESLPIDRGADGAFYYYTAGPDGTLTLSTQRVADPANTSGEKQFLASLDRAKIQAGMRSDLQMRQSARKTRRNLPPKVSGFPCTGSPRGLVLLIEYSDVAFTTPDANDAFSRMLNEEGYSDLGAYGSARDWFIANSAGRFAPDFDVVGPITLNHPRAYYGANKGGDDVRPEMMIIEACGLIADQVDFSKYDEDDDGYIDNVFAFYAGYGENLGAMVPSECIWPHSWDIVDATPVPYYFNGKRLNHYACTNEIDLTDTMDGIGTFVHEFSHVMGLPDLYATNYSFAFTPGSWSVMDEGPYNNNSRTPPYYSSFERLSLGWLDPVRIDRAANIKIPPITENRAYYIATENENEYFLLENRQQTGWDEFIPYHGMLVWHIDYNENIWHYNTVNDRKDHQYVDIIEADDHPHADTRESDPFPGLGGVTSFTDDTLPAMRSWAGNGCGVPLTDIYESNGYIYLKACGGKTVIDPVVALPASEVGIDSFTACWETADEPECEYILSVYQASVTSGGQTVLNYVNGYEALNLGVDVTSALVSGLNPGEEYRYSVRVHDLETNMQSVASNEVTVALLPATFDYLTPKALEASDITSCGFTARWEKMEEAESYLVNVVEKSTGEPSTTDCGFTGGLSALPQGWLTNSKLTYAAEDYCGADTPSLRFNAEGQYLEMLPVDGYARGMRFWLRSVGTTPESNLEVMARIAGEWTNALTLNLNSIDTNNIEIPEDSLPYAAEALRLVFHPAGKGSVAIDDVTLFWGGETTVSPLEAYTDLDVDQATSLPVTGLEPGTVYCYTVTAVKGGVKSKVSNEIRVMTEVANAIGAITAHSFTWSYDPSASRLMISGLESEEMVSVFNADARIILQFAADASGNAEAVLPDSKGLNIFRSRSGYSGKIMR